MAPTVNNLTLLPAFSDGVGETVDTVVPADLEFDLNRHSWIQNP